MHDLITAAPTVRVAVIHPHDDSPTRIDRFARHVLRGYCGVIGIPYPNQPTHFDTHEFHSRVPCDRRGLALTIREDQVW
jgi:hypothetical protein